LGSPPAASPSPPGGATVSIDRGRSLPGRTAASSVENAPSAWTDVISTSVGFRRVRSVHPLPRRGRALSNPCRDAVKRGERVTDRRAAPEIYDAVEPRRRAAATGATTSGSAAPRRPPACRAHRSRSKCAASEMLDSVCRRRAVCSARAAAESCGLGSNLRAASPISRPAVLRAKSIKSVVTDDSVRRTDYPTTATLSSRPTDLGSRTNSSRICP